MRPADAKAADSVPASQLVREGLETCPQIRVGYLASATLGTVFRSRQHLGQHGYRPNWSEKGGMVYTCRAGHIDIVHLRKAADWTAFLAAKTFQQMKNDEAATSFSFRLYEPSRYFVQLTYPEKWKDLPQNDKEHIASDVSIRLGQYFAFVATTWHEILTWFGRRSKPWEDEFCSSFTWEDTFSNLLGTHIAALALQDTQRTFNEAVTLGIDEELKKLDAQPADLSKRASESVRRLWYSGALLWIDMKKRNLDIGLDDGFVTPTLVPSLCECEGAEAQPYPVPNLDFLSEHGFSVRFEIEPREWEKDKILRIVYPDAKVRRKRLEPVVHFAPIMDYIKKDAIRRYGHHVGSP